MKRIWKKVKAEESVLVGYRLISPVEPHWQKL